MSRYASPPVYQWHKIESHQYGYSALPTFMPPTPPVLIPPVNPFAIPPASPGSEPEPEPKAPDDEKKDGSAEEPASEQSPAPGMYIDSL